MKRKLSRAEAGRKGGMTNRQRHGTDHYRKAGAKGFQTTVARHWVGDRAGYLRWLHERGWLKEVQELLTAQPTEGIRCVEIPLLQSELEEIDEDPMQWRTRSRAEGDSRSAANQVRQHESRSSREGQRQPPEGASVSSDAWH
jgi:hypothetical protein